MKRFMIISLSILGVILLIGLLVLQHPAFGRAPRGERLARIERSPHYRDGKFHNLHEISTLTGNKSVFTQLREFLFDRPQRLSPDRPLPIVKTNLDSLSHTDEDALVWLGHSSLYIRSGGISYLVDPVLKAAFPFQWMMKPFKGPDRFTIDDLPKADVLIITHDHYDHLDYPTVKALRDRVGRVICPLGVGEHLEYWGFPADKITEMDWDEDIDLGKGTTLHCLTAQHFSGRGLHPGSTLWASYLIESPARNIYLSGDSGYNDHFKNIAARFDRIDWAVIENGQYSEDWASIHMLPQQVVQAIRDLKPHHVLSIHNSKYALARHAWDEPLRLLAAAAEREKLPLLTPRMGEVVHFNDSTQTFPHWWENVD